MKMRNKPLYNKSYSNVLKKAATLFSAGLVAAGGAGLADAVSPMIASPIVPLAAVDVYEQPNIVFILLDDTGARDLSCYGNTFNETPNIDNVADEGLLFSEYYSSPVCSPSRGALFTGNNPSKTMITEFLDNLNSQYLDPEEFTAFPKVLQEQGYRTGLLGKWHLCAGYENYPTNGAPTYHGFEEIMLSEQRYIGPGYYNYPYYHLPQVTGRPNDKYLVDDMNEEAVRFIDRSKEDDRPFFLMFTHYATHTTLDAPKATVDKYMAKRGETTTNKNVQERNPWLAAMLDHVDNGVGMIDAELEELGISDNTMVVIASDNGGSG